MKITTTILFVGIFVLVFSFYMKQNQEEKELLEVKKQESVEMKTQIEERAFELREGDEIDFIQVQNIKKDRTFWLRKDEGFWYLEYPVAYRADNLVVEGLVAVLKIALKQKLYLPESDWASYGLDEPDFKIGVSTAESKGDKRYFMLIGDEAPLNNAVYAKWEDSNAYFLLPKEVRAAFEKTVYSVREKNVFRIPATKVSRVFIDLGTKTYDWISKGDQWFWMEPLSMLGQKMENEKMMSILWALSNVHVKEFLDKGEKNAFDLGVSMISDRIKLKTADGQEEEFFFGDEAPLKSAYYGTRSGEDTILLVDQAKIFAFLQLLETVEASLGMNSEGSETANIGETQDQDSDEPVGFEELQAEVV